MDPIESSGADVGVSACEENAVLADSASIADDAEGVDDWWECQDPEPEAVEEEEEAGAECIQDHAAAGPSTSEPGSSVTSPALLVVRMQKQDDSSSASEESPQEVEWPVAQEEIEADEVVPFEEPVRKRKIDSVLSSNSREFFPCKKMVGVHVSADTCSSSSSSMSSEVGSTSAPLTLPGSQEDEDEEEEEGSVALCLKRKNKQASVPLEKMKVENSIIPSKTNPPIEITEWLHTFQKWSNAERLLAIDRLIESCEPTQVRHMMQVIEPQFQRDFISLLPRELALYVLMFLEPRDLLRAAQTCRYWRMLAEDNLLWRDKCRAVGIEDAVSGQGRKRHRTPVTSPPNLSAGSSCTSPSATSSASKTDQPTPSPWKAAYMRQHHIEMNWRHKPIRCPRVLKGHDDHVITCLQFSGNRIVSGSDDNTLRVWSASTGKCLRVLVGHTGGVWSSQMSGTTIISGSTDRTLKVWNSESGTCLHTLYGHTSTVRCMHLHGKKVVSGSRDATLRVWNIETGACLHVLVGHLAAVRCVQYDGRLVVSGAYDYMVKVWNPEREECLHTLQGHTNRVYSLQFDGVHVVSGSLDTSIRVWEVESGTLRHTLMGHQSLTSGMELRNRILVSGNADSTVKVWDIITGQCLQTLSGPHKHQSAVTCLQFNNKFVITSSDDGTVKLWDVKSGEFIRNLIALESGGSGGVVWRIRANDTKLVCAVGSRNGTEETKLLVLDFDINSGGPEEPWSSLNAGGGLFASPGVPTPSFQISVDEDDHVP